MKKALSIALSLALTCSLAAPALAAEGDTADARLTAVTQKVKETLNLDTSGYETFNGGLEEGAVTPVWNLQWSGEDGELYVECTEEGRVLSYNVWNNESTQSGGAFGPAFPALSRAEAQETAQDFLDKVLTTGETAEFDAERGVGRLSATDYRFYGDVYLNGLPSPFSFSVMVRASDNTVTRFNYSGSPASYLGGVPSATAAADQAAAAKALADTLSLRLEYVLDGDGGQAVLRYLPNPVSDYYVDAQTGALVDLSALMEDLLQRDGGLYAGGASGDAAPESAMKNMALSQAEQEGIAKLEGVLSKEDLDKAAQAVKALGLSKYALAEARYQVDGETGDVSARLQYARKDGDDVYRRYVTLDARTGGLLAVSSSSPKREEGKSSVSAASAQSKAEAFLKEVCGDDFAKTARYERPSAPITTGGKDGRADHSFCYAQQENGYFFPENALNVTIDAQDGAVSYYSRSFDAGVTFQSPEGIVSADAALAAYGSARLFSSSGASSGSNGRGPGLSYIAVPQALDLADEEYKPLIDMGVKYLYTLKLAYTLNDAYLLGVDAKTGEVVLGELDEAPSLVYDDLSGSWVKSQAETLAAYGVGWLGGSFKPNAELTQLDLVALLVSTDGWLYDSAESEKAADWLYDRAYQMGILSKADRDDGKVLTRAETVKLLLDSAGYGGVAALQGIFRCDFTDQADIGETYLGYAALAQGLGVVKGDSAGRFAPNRIATRAEAAAMLYSFMSR